MEMGSEDNANMQMNCKPMIYFSLKGPKCPLLIQLMFDFD